MRNFKLLAMAAVVAMPAFILTSQAQAAQTVTKTYTYSYDKNKDGVITPDEFTTYVYQQSDRDASGYLSDDEWSASTTRWYKPYDVQYETYTYWDANKDSRLEPTEVSTLVSKSGLYSKWDTNMDGQLSDEEFSSGTFRAYDDNHDGNISMVEWKDIPR